MISQDLMPDFSSFFIMVLRGSTPLLEKLGLKDVVKRDYGRLDSYVDLLLLGRTSKIVPIAASYPLITAVLSILVLGEAMDWIT